MVPLNWIGRGRLETCIRIWEQLNTMVRFKILR